MLADAPLSTLTARSRRFGSRAAIRCGARCVTFVELDDRVARLAAVLRSQGVAAGAFVSLCGPVGWEWVVAYHAILRAGAIVSPINALLAAEEIVFILGHCGARLLIADAATLDRLTATGTLRQNLATIALATIPELGESGAGLDPDPGVDPGSPSTICYTSGTTGRPKGALLSHRSVLMNAGLTALMHGRNADDVTVSALPLAHVYGNVVMNSSLLVGAELVLIPAFTAEAAVAAMVDHRATRFDGVPTMYYRMLEAPSLAVADLSSLRMCTVGGQTMPVERMQDVETRFGCPLVELWGMSEIGGLGTTFPWTGPRVLGSIGLPLPTMQARVANVRSGEALATGEAGELQLRGPLVMQEYLGDGEATKSTFTADGWLKTGDIARMDPDGWIFVVDRLKDLILTSGNNVYPAEIERVIASLPGVVMVGVGRDTDPDKGEVPHAYIVAVPNAGLTAESILAHCRQNLAPYKLPRSVTFVGDLPKTSSGKIIRRELRSSRATQEGTTWNSAENKSRRLHPADADITCNHAEI